MRVWVTRAEPGAGATAVRLAALGHRPLVAPLLSVRRTQAPVPDLAAVGALAFTSANGVRAFAEAVPHREWPVFAVGEATAAAARAAGFAGPASADGDVQALARLILARHGANSAAVLHPCGVERAGDLVGALQAGGVPALSWPLYETLGVCELPPAAAAALDAHELEAILIHSPKAARVAAPLLRGRTQALGGLMLAALSPACAAPLAETPFARRLVASAPDEPSLLARLAT